jgi:hypothetical protein
LARLRRHLRLAEVVLVFVEKDHKEEQYLEDHATPG